MSQRAARAPPPHVRLPGPRGSPPGAGRQTDECLKYLDMLFREYLLYRGLTTTLAAFNQELATEPTAGFRPDAVCDLIFGKLIPSGDLQGLLRIMDFLKSRFYSRLDEQHRAAIQQMDTSLLRLYVSTHWQAGRSDLVSQFFSQRGEAILKGPDAESWRSWFALTHVDSVAREPEMMAFFTLEWAELVEISFRNFLEQVFATMHEPAVLRFSALRQQRKDLQRRVEVLAEENAALRETLANADRAAAGESDLRGREEQGQGQGSSSLSSGAGAAAEGTGGAEKGPDEGRRSSLSELLLTEQMTNGAVCGREAETSAAAAGAAAAGGGGGERRQEQQEHNEEEDEAQRHREASSGAAGQRAAGAVDIPETRITYAHEIKSTQGHQAFTSVCRISPSGEHVASGATDGTVNIWAPPELGGGAMGEKRATTFQAGGPVLSLDWDRRANKVMLVGTSMAGVKAWHLDTLRFVGEYCPEAVRDPMAHVLAIAASPTDQVFAASMATSAAVGWQAAGRLMLFNFRTLLKMGTLAMEPVAGAAPSSMELAGIAGEDPAVVGLDYRADGRVLAAACSDGCVRLFDVRTARGQVLGWVAGRGGSSSFLRFGGGDTTMFTLSSDGFIEEWSLLMQGSGPQSASPVSSLDTREHSSTTLGGASQQGRASLRHHFSTSGSSGGEQTIALTSNTNQLPVLGRAPGGPGWGLRTLSMTLGSCVSAVDLHPFRPIAACGTDTGSVSVHRIDLSETL